MTVRIGITGPIGCGKSTVASWLGELGAVVIDADAVAREVTGPGSPALERIAARFGQEILRDDGSLDRAALARRVFGDDPAALAELEAIVHPAVRPVIAGRIAEAERDGAPAVVVEAIKLVEGGLARLCDEVWLVTCAPEAQLERLRARAAATGADASDAEARVRAQGALVDRLRHAATRVVDTTGGLDETRRRVGAAWSAVLRGAEPSSEAPSA